MIKQIKLVPLLAGLILSGCCNGDKLKSYENDLKKTKSQLNQILDENADLKCRETFALKFGYKFKAPTSNLGFKQINYFLEDGDGKISCSELTNYLNSLDKP